MMKKTGTEIDNKKNAQKILRILPYNKAFFFFTDIGEYSGEAATSFPDFCKKIETINIKSIDFHFKRQDFERWIRETLGDSKLADDFSQIRKAIHGEPLRDKIHQVLEQRLAKLKKLLASKEAYLEHF